MINPSLIHNYLGREIGTDN